jgi:hypothetical protein
MMTARNSEPAISGAPCISTSALSGEFSLRLRFVEEGRSLMEAVSGAPGLIGLDLQSLERLGP